MFVAILMIPAVCFCLYHFSIMVLRGFGIVIVLERLVMLAVIHPIDQLLKSCSSNMQFTNSYRVWHIIQYPVCQLLKSVAHPISSLPTPEEYG